MKPVLAFPPQPITAPLALEPADVAAVGLDFVPNSFVGGPVKKGAALISREGDFGFSAANGNPEAGHDVELVNFSQPGKPLQLQLQRFAYNTTFEQAFPDGLRGINRPVDLKFGPDDCAYLVDYGAVRDFGQSDPASKFINSRGCAARPDSRDRRDLEDLQAVGGARGASGAASAAPRSRFDALSPVSQQNGGEGATWQIACPGDAASKGRIENAASTDTSDSSSASRLLVIVVIDRRR